MEPEQILSEYGFVRLLGVDGGSNEVLWELDTQVLGERSEGAELVHVKLDFDNVLCIHLELQPLLTELEEITFQLSSDLKCWFTFVPILTGVSSSLS